TTPLNDGTYSVTAATLDSAANKSVPSPATQVTIDTVPPAVPAAPALDPASDTPPLGDNTTTVSSPFVTGTAASDVRTVTVFADGNQVGTATPNPSSGVWRFQLPTLANGAPTATVL